MMLRGNVARWMQKSEIKILIPDGVAHSTVIKILIATQTAQVTTDKMILMQKQWAQLRLFPIIQESSTMLRMDILVLSITIQLLRWGNREEADTGIVKKSEFLLDYRDNKISEAFNRATKNRSITNYANENETGTPELINLWGKTTLN